MGPGICELRAHYIDCLTTLPTFGYGYSIRDGWNPVKGLVRIFESRVGEWRGSL